jgi:hypothetical protein
MNSRHFSCHASDAPARIRRCLLRPRREPPYCRTTREADDRCGSILLKKSLVLIGES